MGLVNFEKFVWDYATYRANPTNLNKINDGLEECGNAINSGMIDELGVIKANVAKDSEKLGGKLPNEYQPAGNYQPAGSYEPSFTKNSAFNKDFGTAVDAVCQGNDSRLSDSRKCNNTFDSAATSRTNLGLTGTSNTTHYHNSQYYAKSEIDTKLASVIETLWGGDGTTQVSAYGASAVQVVCTKDVTSFRLLGIEWNLGYSTSSEYTKQVVWIDLGTYTTTYSGIGGVSWNGTTYFKIINFIARRINSTTIEFYKAYSHTTDQTDIDDVRVYVTAVYGMK